MPMNSYNVSGVTLAKSIQIILDRKDISTDEKLEAIRKGTEFYKHVNSEPTEDNKENFQKKEFLLIKFIDANKETVALDMREVDKDIFGYYYYYFKGYENYIEYLISKGAKRISNYDVKENFEVIYIRE